MPVFWLEFYWLFSGVPVDNGLGLVQVMAWHKPGAMLLPEQMTNQFVNAYTRHRPSMSWRIESQWRELDH